MNTQLVFPLDIPPLRFTACAAIEHWSSGCYNNQPDDYFLLMNIHFISPLLFLWLLLLAQLF